MVSVFKVFIVFLVRKRQSQLCDKIARKLCGFAAHRKKEGISRARAGQRKLCWASDVLAKSWKKDRNMCCRHRSSPTTRPWRSAADVYIQELELTWLRMKVCTLKSKPTVLTSWSSRPARCIKRGKKRGRLSKNKGGRQAVVKFIEEHNRKKKCVPTSGSERKW